MLGWGDFIGDFIGGFVGAAAGAEEQHEWKAGKLTDLVLDAIRSGHMVLVVHTRTGAKATLVRDVVGDSVGLQNAALPFIGRLFPNTF